MQVHILGPLRVIRGTTVATPSAPKLRQVLALFAVNAGSEVRTEQIIEELWEDQPPVSAMTTLQTYVYQLRKLLQLAAETGANGAQRSRMPALRTSPGGYVLALPPEALDCREFERLAERGRAHLETGRREEAAETLRSALQLWRGPALSDVGVGPVLQASAVRLEEIRKSVLEHRIEAELALGRHHELISELTGIVSQQPTHEGFQAKLILALYRTGRRSDALHVYQRARVALAEELGLEPSPELERLHRAVLVADSVLDPPNGAQTRAGARTARTMPPRQLPADTAPIVGRDRNLDQIRQVLQTPDRSVPPVVLICGIPGSGKSTFCVHAAHALRSLYPDGQLFAELLDPTGTPVEPSATLGYWLRAAGVPDEHVPAAREERTRLFRSWTAQRRILVVLDDATSIDQLLPLLPTGSGCAALVTCRRRLSGPPITSTAVLEPLGARDAEAMLTTLLDYRRIADDPAAVRELVEVCAGSPLALRTAATKLSLRPHWPIRRILVRIRPDRHCSPAVSAQELGITASVGRTDRLMPPALRAMFRTLAAPAAQPGHPATAAAAARVWGVDPGYAEALLEDLVEFQLAEVERAGNEPEDGFRYRIQPLVRACAEHLDEIEEHREPRPAALTPG